MINQNDIPRKYILHLETSSKYCSVALSHNGSLIALRESSVTLDHSATLVPYIKQLLTQSNLTPKDLTAISVSAGPGSYTGLRVGVSTAKAMCWVLDIPMIAVDTLYSLALAAMAEVGEGDIPARPATGFYPILDARRMEVYIAGYDSAGQQTLENQAFVVTKDGFEDLRDSAHRTVICGEGIDKCREVLDRLNILWHPVNCSAKYSVEPAWEAFSQQKFADITSFVPNYLKPPNITVSKV